MLKAELFYHATCSLGEGPVWDTDRDGLWWVDIKKKRVYWLASGANAPLLINLSQMVGMCVPTTDQRLLVGLENNLEVIQPETGHAEVLYPIETDLPKNRCNDGKCDAAGRLWIGTMNTETQDRNGNFYSYTPQNGLQLQRSGCSISNGLCWSKDNQTLYYIDSPDQNIKAFDFDLQNGAIKNERIIAKIEDTDGTPDGMTIDTSGNLWVALWGGASVKCFSPATGKVIETIQVPALQPTCCTFGGSDLRTLYITSARTGMSEEQLKEFPLSGSVFQVQLPTGGYPPHRMKL